MKNSLNVEWKTFIENSSKLDLSFLPDFPDCNANFSDFH